ncbi:unnamed protein product, partial [Symbiodinium pilosum]
EVEGDAWKRGYRQDPTWRRAAPAPGESSKILRKYRSQLAAAGIAMRPKRTLKFEKMAARDELRLQDAIATSHEKRQAAKDGRTEPNLDGSDLEL